MNTVMGIIAQNLYNTHQTTLQLENYYDTNILYEDS